MPSMTPSDIGRLMQAQQRRIRHTCPECGQEFEAITRALYCSAQCRNRVLQRRYRAAHKRPPSLYDATYNPLADPPIESDYDEAANRRP